MSSDNPYANLGAVEQKLYQETTPQPPEETGENAGKQGSQHSRKPENQHAGMLANQTAGTPASQQSGNTQVRDHTTSTEKVTYRFHAEGKYAVEDMKTILARKHGIKASLEEIAEESILLAYEDLLANQEASKLANRLSSTPENKHSS